MTHTMNETAEMKEQIEIIKVIHDQIVDAIDQKPYACAMSAMTKLMISLYDHHTEDPSVEDFMNKMYAVYMAHQMIHKGEGATKQ